MRGFAFSVDMAFGALLVILLISLFSQSIQPTPALDSHTLLQIRAKDAVMKWFYSYPGVDPVPQNISTNIPHACSLGFRPVVELSDGTRPPLDPSLEASWVFQTECVSVP